jgi:hypothetical protein
MTEGESLETTTGIEAELLNGARTWGSSSGEGASLDDLVRNPGHACGLAPRQTAALAARAVVALAAILGAVASGSPHALEEKTPRRVEDRWLTTEEVVKKWPAVFSRKWLYSHAELPFVRHISRRKNVYSEAGIRRWIASRPQG